MPRGEPQIQKGGAEGGSFPAPEEVAHTYPGTIPQERPIVMTAAYMWWGECFPQEQLGTLH